MSAVVPEPAVTWAAAHHTLLLLLALAIAVVAALAVTLVVQAAAREPATRGGTPVEDVDLACDYLPMTGTFC